MFGWFKKRKRQDEELMETDSLCNVADGQSVVIKHLKGKDLDCQRLREMGFCEQARVEKISGKGTLICRVCDSKVVISQGLAKNILVNACPENEENSMKNIVLLSELSQGQKAIVHDFIEENDTCARLEEMGVTPGESVEVIRYAPLGDPVEIRIRGYMLSLRKEEAELIQVEIL